MGTVVARGKGKGHPPTFYHHYILREDEHPPAGLLGLQSPYGRGAQAHPDELLFVAIHQTYEIWFKVMIDELLRLRTGVIARVKGGKYQAAARALRRLSKITRVLRDQYEIVETISPTDFLVFRDLLRPSSGYDSCQFRALELSAGLRRDGAYLRHLVGEKEARGTDAGELASFVARVAEDVEKGRDPKLSEYSLVRKIAGTGDAKGLKLIARSLAADSLRDAAYEAVEGFGAGSGKGKAATASRSKAWRRAQEQAESSKMPFAVGIDPVRAARVEQATARLYRTATGGELEEPRDRALLDLVEALVEFDESFRNLRTVHINMVLRVIGSRPGTGGSSGAPYLRTTLDFEFFPLFWSARNVMDPP